jgi:hypothetical protein
VGSNAFGECKYLKAVELSEKTKTFNAFCSCPELEDEHAGDENKVIESTLDKLFYFGLFALTVVVVSADCAELIVKHGDSAGQTIAVSAMELAVIFIGSTILVAFYQFLTENLFVSDRKCLNGNEDNEAYRLIDEFYGTGSLDFDGTAFLAQCFISASAYVSIRLMWIGGKWAAISKIINPIIAFTVQQAGKVFENVGHPAVIECLFAAAILALQMKVAAMAMQVMHKRWIKTTFGIRPSKK